jgi:hypothetical protein
VINGFFAFDVIQHYQHQQQILSDIHPNIAKIKKENNSSQKDIILNVSNETQNCRTH